MDAFKNLKTTTSSLRVVIITLLPSCYLEMPVSNFPMLLYAINHRPPQDASVSLQTTSKSSVFTFTSLESISLEYGNSVISNKVDLKHPLLNSLIYNLLLLCIFKERLHEEQLISQPPHILSETCMQGSFLYEEIPSF
uniref:Uncharacterized protein n=1 Tax=Solanum lycopersicum TaxID=4081 RepID=A0A3Q7FYG0_SOLLC